MNNEKRFRAIERKKHESFRDTKNYDFLPKKIFIGFVHIFTKGKTPLTMALLPYSKDEEGKIQWCE